MQMESLTEPPHISLDRLVLRIIHQSFVLADFIWLRSVEGWVALQTPNSTSSFLSDEVLYILSGRADCSLLLWHLLLNGPVLDPSKPDNFRPVSELPLLSNRDNSLIPTIKNRHSRESSITERLKWCIFSCRQWPPCGFGSVGPNRTIMTHWITRLFCPA